jgi:hypothetical protein
MKSEIKEIIKGCAGVVTILKENGGAHTLSAREATHLGLIREMSPLVRKKAFSRPKREKSDGENFH